MAGRKNSSKPFWERKTLDEMNSKEWELICDGCGKCCCFRSSATGTVAEKYACELLDPVTCQCTDYTKRKQLVPDCFQITPKNIYHASWLPASCSYWLLANNKPLPKWHHLLSKSRDTVHELGRSIRGKTVKPDQNT